MRKLFLILIMLVLMAPQTALALSAKELRSIEYDSVWYEEGSDSTGGGSTAGCLSIKYPNVVDEVAFANTLDTFIKSNFPRSPWLTIPELGKVLSDEGIATDINPIITIAIGINESSMGVNIPTNSFNSFGRSATPSQPRVPGRIGAGWYKWNSFQDSLTGPDGVFKFLKNRYAQYDDMLDLAAIYLVGHTVVNGTVEQKRALADIDGNTVGAYYDKLAQSVNKITSASDSGVDCSGGEIIEGIVFPPNLGTANSQGYYTMPDPVAGEYTFNGGTPPSERCGSKELVGLIYTISQKWRAQYPGSLIRVGDLNASGHASHEEGVDWDMFTSDLSGADMGGDRERSIQLGKWLAQTKLIEVIFYNDSVVQEAVNGYARENNLPMNMTNWPGHEDHFHVRILSQYRGVPSQGCAS